LVALLGSREFEHLHFLKLMLPENAACIFASSPRFGTKAGRPRADLNGQLIRIENLVSIEAGQLDFCGWCEPEVGSFQAEHFSRKLGQLPNARQRCRVHEKWWKVFRISIGRVCV